MSKLKVHFAKHTLEQRSAFDTTRNDYVVLAVTSIQKIKLKELTSCAPDVFIFDTNELSNATLNLIRIISYQYQIPVIVCCRDESDGAIEAAIECGASTYIAGYPQSERLNSILKAAIAKHTKTMQLMLSLEKTETQLETRKIVEQAKGIVMSCNRLTEHEAHELMQKTAMNSNMRMLQLAELILTTREVPKHFK